MWREGGVPEVPSAVALGWGAVGGGVQLYVPGFDPGGKSGWAVLRCPLVELRSEGFAALALAGGVTWRAGELRGPEPFQAECILAILRAVYWEGGWFSGPLSDRCVVAWERFTLRLLSSDSDLLSPVRITAMTEALSWRGLLFPVVQHQPVDAMKVVTDERLRRWGFWHPSEHARDALRHAILVAKKMTDPTWWGVVEGRMRWLGDSSNEQSTA